MAMRIWPFFSADELRPCARQAGPMPERAASLICGPASLPRGLAPKRWVTPEVAGRRPAGCRGRGTRPGYRLLAGKGRMFTIARSRPRRSPSFERSGAAVAG